MAIIPVSHRIIFQFRRLSLVAVGLIVIAFSTLKLRAEPQVEDSFSKYDVDSSGFLTAAEFNDEALFFQVDENHDGRITLKEAKLAARQGMFRGVRLPSPSKNPKREQSEQDRPPNHPAFNPQQQTNVESGEKMPSILTEDIRQAPKRMLPSKMGIGRQIKLPTLTDAFGKRHPKEQWQNANAVVIAMTGTGCPLCLKYAPSLAAIEDRYNERGVRFLYVNPNESETKNRLRVAIENHGLDGPYIHDLDMSLTQSLGVETSTEVFVLDQSGTLCYRGAIDDQYGFGYSLDEPRTTYLCNALDAVLTGKTPETSATTSPGCEIYLPNDLPAPVVTAVTYHGQVARILQTHCVTCHREQGSAPFPLEQYEQVTDFGKMVASVVTRGIMPPWFATNQPPSNPVDSQENTNDLPRPTQHWANDRSLPQKDRQQLLQWVQEGMPEGDPSDAPLPMEFPTEWQIGKPDLVLQIPSPIQVKAQGQMPYEHRIVDTTLREDKWVSAVEVKPTAPEVVHHVLIFIANPETTRPEIDEEAGFFAAFAPGNNHQIYPDGFAKKLPAGTRLIFQMHYTPNGKATSDQTQLAVRFTDKPPVHAVLNHGIANHRISIPAGENNHLETASLTVPRDLELLAMMPHMHVRGKAFRYELVSPNGVRSLLLDVPRYDFNWQLEYRLAEPLSLAAGSRIELSAWYDNSSDNPANPDHTKTVGWGKQTTEEMMLGYIEFVRKDQKVLTKDDTPQDPSSPPLSAADQARYRWSIKRIFDRVDKDRNGIVTKTELQSPLLYNRMDLNQDGVINRDDLEAPLPARAISR